MTEKFIDQLLRKVEIEVPPKRIISLVPSLTELICDLGMEASLVGITKFCVHPENLFKDKQRVGGTKRVDLDKVEKLNPDLIIANKEENTADQIEALSKMFPVWISDISSLEDAMVMILTLGKIFNRILDSVKLVGDIEKGFDELNRLSSTLSAAYFIWKDPYMVAGAGTFVNDVMQHAGFKNVFEDVKRYPAATPEAIVARNPSVIFLSSEPFPFKEEHLIAMEAIIPDAEVILVDGEMFSWYGSRLLKAVDYLRSLRAEISSKKK